MTDPPAPAFAPGVTKPDQPLVAYAAVYPLVMILRVFIVQVLILMLPHVKILGFIDRKGNSARSVYFCSYGNE